MSDNKKIPTSSSFLKRNFFIIVFITVLIIGGADLYLNNKNFIQTISKADPVIEPVIEAKKINPNKDLEMKVANLEKLILELSSTMQEVQTKSSEQVIVQPQKNIIEVKDLDAYELLKSMNMILLNIDDQQIRNSNVLNIKPSSAETVVSAIPTLLMFKRNIKLINIVLIFLINLFIRSPC